MEQKTCQKFIYKLPSKILRKAKWNLDLPLDIALREYPEYVVSLGDSQILRFIDELNGIQDSDSAAKSIKRKIRLEKKKPRSKNTKSTITYLYKKLYELQFQPDYLCVIMNCDSDYDRANKGFKVNGITYHRLLGTNGGIKNSTIVYVSERLYPELKRRMDNGRNKEMKIVPAKLESYQALICSGSTPIPQPDGVIVVNDCITHFKDDVIMINDETDGEPIMTFEKDFEIEHNDSDGYGLMSPSYSRRVNKYLSGKDEVISGMNTRWAWDKGMIYTFDYVEFGLGVAHSFEVIDAWGDKRDVRCADVILTTSMLKLWDSYDSWEDYYRNCRQNHYKFATPKVTPEKLENVRNTNYQFLQSYEFTDEELQELCQPTIDEIKDVLGMDYRKSLVFLAGYELDIENVFTGEYDYYVKALMINPDMINDPFIRRRIWNMICKRIEMGKRGAIKIDANFAMISGDPYALCQSMFGLEITGLLKAGELYHKYWIDKGSKEVACFRAPMTCHNNIRRMKLVNNDEVQHWYRYITTAIIYNAWDTACDAMNGADKDGDTNMDTDNPIIVRNTLNSPTIMCVQRKAEKKVPSEDDIIKANKLAFNDDIGTVTNYVTSMIERQAGFPKDSKEYNILAYRIMCGQLYQQNTIDRAKGIIAKPMPDYWYNIRKCIIHEDDDEQTKREKELNLQLVASAKPYFMTYVYPTLRTENNTYIKNNNYDSIVKFKKYGVRSLKDLYAIQNKTPEMLEFIRCFERFQPVGNNPCVINRICWIFENEFDGYLSKRYSQPDFDYEIMKSHVEYSRSVYKEIEKIYEEYQRKLNNYKNQMNGKRTTFEINENYHMVLNEFRVRCEEVCSNEDELCDIVLDLCYQTNKSKQFAWDVCGEKIIDNLLKQSDYKVTIPIHVEHGGDFTYCGEKFEMCTYEIGGDEDNDYFE